MESKKWLIDLSEPATSRRTPAGEGDLWSQFLGPQNMMAGKAKCQRVIATFNNVGTFADAVETLLKTGFCLEQLCIAALTATLMRLPIPEKQPQSAFNAAIDGLALNDHVETAATASQDLQIVGICGNVWDTSRTNDTPSRFSRGAALLPCIPADLVDQIRGGIIVLVVSPVNSEQQRKCTRILLQISPHHVETRDFNRYRTEGCAHRAIPQP